MKGLVAKMKKNKVVGKLIRSVSSKSSKLMYSLTSSSQKKSANPKGKITYASANQQKLMVSTTNSVGAEADMMEQKMTVVARGPTTPKRSSGESGSIHGSSDT